MKAIYMGILFAEDNQEPQTHMVHKFFLAVCLFANIYKKGIR